MPGVAANWLTTVDDGSSPIIHVPSLRTYRHTERKTTAAPASNDSAVITELQGDAEARCTVTIVQGDVARRTGTNQLKPSVHAVKAPPAIHTAVVESLDTDTGRWRGGSTPDTIVASAGDGKCSQG